MLAASVNSLSLMEGGVVVGIATNSCVDELFHTGAVART